jgi:lantibiotic modifying enzyme
MQEKIPFHNISNLESLIINIQEDGQENVWKLIESIKNPFKRCQNRKMFGEALRLIERIK